VSVGLKEIDEKREPDRYISTIAIAAAIIAAVRLAKVVDLELSFDKVKTVVTQSVFLARTILDEAKQRF